MSTGTIWQTSTSSSEATEQLAGRLGRALKGGEIIELMSDLGGGKTTFVRGLVRGAGSTDKVASPTFTLSKLYRAKHFEIHHFDFYRLQDPGIMVDELVEIIDDPHAVVVVEWADVVQHVLPERRLSITIQQGPAGDRRFTFGVPSALHYLMEALK